MRPPSLVPEAANQKDREQIRLLAIFHFVMSALALAGIGFLIAHYFIMHSVFLNPETWKGGRHEAPPKELFEVFVWFYYIMGGMLIVAGTGNILSGIFLLKGRNRMFSLIVAGVNCLQIPVGTVLGVFTLIVLMRDSVRQFYAANQD